VRRLDIAEAILSLVADRERATAIAGDLLEESRGHAPRFWWLVAQTTFLRTGRRLSAAPFGMFGPAIRAMLLQSLWIFAIFVVGFIGLSMAAVISKFIFQHDLISALQQDHGSLGVGQVFGLIIPFMIGRWLARRYPGREASVIATLTVLNIAFTIVTSWLLWQFVRIIPGGPPGGQAVFGYQGLSIAWNLDLLIGAAAAIGGELLHVAVQVAGAAFGRYKSLRLN
jgi:hypothetical protein